MKRFFLQSLYFTRVERIGTVFLLFFCAMLYGIPYLLRAPLPNLASSPLSLQILKPPQEATTDLGAKNVPVSGRGFKFDPNKASLDDFVRLGLSEKVAQSICRYREKGGKFRKAEDFKKIYTLKPADYERLFPFIQINDHQQTNQRDMPVPLNKPAVAELFEFDPNTASESDLGRLGLPKSAVKGMLSYRNKGGVFRKKEDVQKIYTLPQDVYERVAPYMALPPDPGEAVLRPAAYHGGVSAYPSPKKFPVAPVDLNRSSLEDWMTLPGIGETRGRQIINFREKLGGFLSVEQVAETSGLPDSVFQRIKPLLNPDVSEPRKININTATWKDLNAHPYCSGKQAQHIINYRSQHGPYTSLAELDNIEAFKDKLWLAQIKRYLRLD